MRQFRGDLKVRAQRSPLTEITAPVRERVVESGIRDGLCTIFIQHTSASLTIQENADPSARRDLERFLAKIAPEGDPAYEHTAEGPDDMPAHLRSALTATTLGVPVAQGDLALGTWQGIFLWEHRRGAPERRVLIHIIGE